MQSTTRQSRILVSALLVLALVVAAAAGLAWRSGSGPGSSRNGPTASAGHSIEHGEESQESEEGDEGEQGEEDRSRVLGEALEKRPALADHRMPLAFVAEKLEQQGGEGSGEIVNGPSQESYDQRAYPREAIATTQQQAAQRAGLAATQRARTAEGRGVLNHALGASATNSWLPVGPEGGLQVPQSTYTGQPAFVSGRATSLAVGDTCTPSSCLLFVGTAGGGVWRTTNALATIPTWTAIGKDIPSTAIGSLTRTSDGTLFVGTGEPNGSGDSEAGLGLFKSSDNGNHFTKVPTFKGPFDFTLGRGVGSVAVDPGDPAHILVGTAVARHGSSSSNGGRFTPPGSQPVGLYETLDGGGSWSLALRRDSDEVNPGSPTGGDYFRGGISKIVFDPTHPGTVYASMFDYGLFRATGPGGAWDQIYTINTPGDPATGLDSRLEFDTATLPNGNTRIYLGDSTYYDDSVSGLLRTDNAGATRPTWTELSDPTPGTPGYGSYNFCHAQCSYDMVVASPPGAPDEVFLSGSMNYDELQAFGGPGSSNGRAVVRSADSGVHFTDMTNDASDNGLHPDHHDLAFAPTTDGKETFFSASDGGVVRQNGPYVDRSADCAGRGLGGAELVDCEQFLSAVPTFNNSRMNKGLQTLQFQSVSVGRTGILQAGTQDNGTWESDSHNFAETVGGDGGQSGFNKQNPSIRYHSYYGPAHDVSFTKGNPTGWDWISDPLYDSGESASFYVPFIADPRRAGTIFTGLQHVWRSKDNGGDRAFLDQYCNELTGDYGNRPMPCGDWVPLGGAAGDLSGGNPSNYVVAIERFAGDPSTMWVGTRLGDLYVTTNANAANPNAVKFRRLDETLGLPNRFPSGIALDQANPRHVFVSYSGYSAYSPGGHVYELKLNPATGAGTATDRSSDLGDQPVTDVAWDPNTKSLFASTDFGVLVRVFGSSTSWVATPGIPHAAVYGLTYDVSSHMLYAATHGRSIWKLAVGSPT